MATIEKRKNRSGQLIGYRIRVRRRGFPDISETFDNFKEAEARAAVLESEMARGVFVDRSLQDKMTLADVIDSYIKNVVPQHKGKDVEEIRLKRILRDHAALCQYSLANLRTEHFEEYRDARLKLIKPGSCVRELNLLHSVLESVRRRVGMIENPVSHVRRPKVNDARDVRLSPKQEAALMEALKTTRNKWLKPFVILAIQSAMRRSEILSLTWDNVDLENQTAFLPEVKSDGKSGQRSKGRTVPLSSSSVATLKALHRADDDNRVFRMTLDSLKHAWTRARDRAKLPHLHLHDLRHEATSRLAEKGWNVLELAAVTGHQDLQMLKRYANLRAEDLARKMG